MSENVQQADTQADGKSLYESYQAKPDGRPMFGNAQNVNWDELPEVARNDWNRLAKVVREREEAKQQEQAQKPGQLLQEHEAAD